MASGYEGHGLGRASLQTSLYPTIAFVLACYHAVIYQYMCLVFSRFFCFSSVADMSRVPVTDICFMFLSLSIQLGPQKSKALTLC